MKTIHKEEYKVLIDCLRQLRKSANLTQKELAKKIETDQTFVSKYERCERRIDMIELMAICKGLKIEFTEFIRVFENRLKKVKK